MAPTATVTSAPWLQTSRRVKMMPFSSPLPPPHPRPATWAQLRAPCAWNLGSAHFLAHHPAHAGAPPSRVPAAPPSRTLRARATMCAAQPSRSTGAGSSTAVVVYVVVAPAHGSKRSRRPASVHGWSRTRFMDENGHGCHSFTGKRREYAYAANGGSSSVASNDSRRLAGDGTYRG